MGLKVTLVCGHDNTRFLTGRAIRRSNCNVPFDSTMSPIPTSKARRAGNPRHDADTPRKNAPIARSSPWGWCSMPVDSCVARRSSPATCANITRWPRCSTRSMRRALRQTLRGRAHQALRRAIETAYAETTRQDLAAHRPAQSSKPRHRPALRHRTRHRQDRPARQRRALHPPPPQPAR